MRISKVPPNSFGTPWNAGGFWTPELGVIVTTRRQTDRTLADLFCARRSYDELFSQDSLHCLCAQVQERRVQSGLPAK